MDLIRKQFTGYERDGETGLDFAEARMYSNKLGRFTSADPIFITPERLLDPQRLNLFLYVRNNPVKYTDVSGKDIQLDPKVKKADADRIIKVVSETYRREIGKRAIDKMEESKIPVIFTVGKVEGGGLFGRTSIAVTVTRQSRRHSNLSQLLLRLIWKPSTRAMERSICRT